MRSLPKPPSVRMWWLAGAGAGAGSHPILRATPVPTPQVLCVHGLARRWLLRVELIAKQLHRRQGHALRPVTEAMLASRGAYGPAGLRTLFGQHSFGACPAAAATAAAAACWLGAQCGRACMALGVSSLPYALVAGPCVCAPGRDTFGELTTAFRAHGLRAGIYINPSQVTRNHTHTHTLSLSPLFDARGDKLRMACVWSHPPRPRCSQGVGVAQHAKS